MLPLPVKIRDLNIQRPILLAPMAGVTDHPFRLLCRQFGAGGVFTEFVSSDGLIRGNEKTLTYLRFTEAERPLGIQIFGHDPDTLAHSAEFIQNEFQPDIIDLNVGCPVPKVVKRQAGSALLKDLHLLRDIATTVRKKVSIPFTAKIRAGWDAKNIVAAEAAKILEDCGIDMITIHPRTTRQRYTGHADWSLIADVKQAVSVPVIGNGDITSPQKAKEMLDQTGCDGLMIGRAATGNPQIFRNIITYLESGNDAGETEITQRFEIIYRHIKINRKTYDEQHGANMFKTHAASYLKGLPRAAAYRDKLHRARNLETIHGIIEEYHHFLTR